MRQKKITGVLWMLLVIGWMFMGSYANAETQPKLEYIYTDGGNGDNQLVVVSINMEETGWEEAMLSYWNSEGNLVETEAVEIIDDYAAFLLTDTNVDQSSMTTLEVVSGESAYYIDLQEFFRAEDTLTAPVAGEISEEVESVIAEDSGEISDTLEEAEKLNESNASSREVVLSGGDGLNRAGQQIVVVLDPGHGGSDWGAYRTWDGIRYVEKEIALKISQYTKAELENYQGVTVYLTRSGDVAMELAARVNYASSVGATVLVSQHINSTSSTQTTATGAEVMVSSGNYKPSQANETATIARMILTELENIGFRNRDLVYRMSETGNTYPNGKLADYYGIVRLSVLAGFPGMIVEHGFVSNPSDCIAYYGSDAKIKQLGVADATAIAKYYGLQRKDGANSSASTGWQEENGKWYYLDGTGKRVKSSWLTLNGNTYYMDADGYKMTGWRNIDGNRYFFSIDGIRRTGFVITGGEMFWFNSKGVLKTGFFKGSNGNRYYTNKSGYMYTGWQTYKGKTYYFDPETGAAAIGWRKIDKYYYHFDANGRMQTGMLTLADGTYYLRPTGRRASGFVYYNKKKYYFDKSTGKMASSQWVQYKGNWYFFRKKGPAYRSITKKIAGKRYKFNAKGICTNYQ